MIVSSPGFTLLGRTGKPGDEATITSLDPPPQSPHPNPLFLPTGPNPWPCLSFRECGLYCGQWASFCRYWAQETTWHICWGQWMQPHLDGAWFDWQLPCLRWLASVYYLQCLSHKKAGVFSYNRECTDVPVVRLTLYCEFTCKAIGCVACVRYGL